MMYYRKPDQSYSFEAEKKEGKERKSQMNDIQNVSTSSTLCNLDTNMTNINRKSAGKNPGPKDIFDPLDDKS